MSATVADKVDVVIAGGGPVGLLLGCLLLRRGISCRVLERRTEVVTHSRSVGIHPVALEVFDELRIAERFIEEGHRIERGQAWVNDRHAGTVSFARCPPPFRFILTLPQYRTEALLEQCLRELDPAALLRRSEFVECHETERDVTVVYRRDGETAGIGARMLAGCDGMHSTVRTAAGIDFDGGAYPDTYVMGDFDDTGTRADAEIYLHQDGLVESIPLPDNRRRWVVKTGSLLPGCGRDELVDRVRHRLGIDLRNGTHYMLSAFGVQHYLARTFVRGRIALAGDAAHVISPIGGQGMNLGWLDAYRLAQVLAKRDEKGLHPGDPLRRYGHQRRAAAEKARKRGEFNMMLGRRFARPHVRRALVRAMLMPPAAGKMANVFTMRGL